jgi:undecaprenyl-phosphate galactose phosphotransferase
VKAYKILSIRPGLTGPWQVSGRSDISCYQKRIQLDEHYVDNHSLILDLKLIAKTVPAMVSSKGAY